MKPKFITFEGIENCGKTTQIGKLEEYLTSRNIPVEVVKEPGTTSLGGALRRLIKNPEEVYKIFNKQFSSHHDFTPLDVTQKRTDKTEVMLFLAARAEFISHIVNPKLKQGTSLISDRFYDSTLAYQGGGRFNEDRATFDMINMLNEWVIGRFIPDRTFYLDIPYEVMVARGDPSDFMESSGREFFNRVINIYDQIADRNQQRVIKIDGTKLEDDVFSHIKSEVDKLYGFS